MKNVETVIWLSFVGLFGGLTIGLVCFLAGVNPILPVAAVASLPLVYLFYCWLRRR